MSKSSAGMKSDAKLTRSVLDELPVTVEAVLGSAQITVSQLRALGEGDSLTLDHALGDPVVLRLNGVAIAFGELVAVGENFGVRIQKMADA